MSSLQLAASTSVQNVGLEVIRRNGAIVPFQSEKIAAAMTKAFLAVSGQQGVASAKTRDLVRRLTETVMAALTRRLPAGGTVHIEDIQDQVELALMRSGEHDVARAYVLYREKRAAARATEAPASEGGLGSTTIHMIAQGKRRPLDMKWLQAVCFEACEGLAGVDSEAIVKLAVQNLYDGVEEAAVYQALVLAARTLIEQDPDYGKAASRLLLRIIRGEVLQQDVLQADMGARYPEALALLIDQGVEAELLDLRLKDYDLGKLGQAIVPERDFQFDYLGLQTLYDRYFLHREERRIELPQTFFMRVAMGLAINEINREERAIEFYHLLSSFDFMSSTPTLFNSGTRHPQLSSCYLTTVSDDLDGIYQGIKENALLQKYAGGLGNDWTPVRSLGSRIKGTNGKSQGVIPFLKVVNDTALAVNQGGKRKGAVCAYLETWHLDIEEYLELRKNTGDDRRRTHDMNTAHWIPDLFMKRVAENGEWTLFSPSDVPDLHERFGESFETAYRDYEAKALRGEIPLSKRVPAVQLWRKMLTMLFETGHPWITFKDACNLRSPQQHVGVIHSSNLCTEITLNTSHSETAVCNLGSVNLLAHLVPGEEGWHLDQDKLGRTVRSAMRLLDNVVDINFYPTRKARNANVRHRPVGLGIMGFSNCLQRLGIPYASEEAVEFADRSMEAICYHAYWTSTELAEERGRYSTFSGSLWDKGILPHESVDILEKSRGGFLELDLSAVMDWNLLKVRIASHGMRNSNCVAIAPTATISNIVGVSASIEPEYQNLYVKSNLSGEFTVVNETLVKDLKALGLWDAVMLSDLKYFDGALGAIDRIPEELKSRYATAFEIDPVWLVEAAARRQKWIDQAQSLNLYVASASGKKLDELYRLAWKRGLKTTYYLRTLGATAMEKGLAPVLTEVSGSGVQEPFPKACSILDLECEACQ